MSEGKAARLNVRVTPAQHAEVAWRAALAGLGVSEYVRRRALSDADAPQIVADVATLRALHANLKRAGGNLNQVARTSWHLPSNHPPPPSPTRRRT